jgi:hypothetical protein
MLLDTPGSACRTNGIGAVQQHLSVRHPRAVGRAHPLAGERGSWSRFDLDAAVAFEGPGDILIAVVNRTAGVTPATFPAVIDQSSASQGRSWAGFGAVPGDPPEFPLPNFGVIDSFGQAFAGNWLVRGFGTAIFPCENPADVPWLSASPAAGTTAASAQSQVTVSLDSTGLASGNYGALLCLESNDPDTPLIEIPVSLEVEPSARIEVSETALSGAAEVNGSAQTSFEIGNGGDAQLDWTVDTFDNGLGDTCQPPAAVSWLSIDPAAGSTAPDDSDTVSVTMDAAGLSAGTHDATVCVFSNDPLLPLVSLPVSFEVSLIPQAITFGELSDRILGAAPFTAIATADSGLDVTFASGTGMVCSVAADEVTLLAPGTCTIIASQAGDGVYAEALDVSRSFQVIDPTVTIAPGTLSLAWIDEVYLVQLTASGDASVAPFTFAVTAGTLPDGMTLDGEGELSGIPIEAGEFVFTVTATDSTPGTDGGPFSGSRVFTLDVIDPIIFLDGFEAIED